MQAAEQQQRPSPASPLPCAEDTDTTTYVPVPAVELQSIHETAPLLVFTSSMHVLDGVLWRRAEMNRALVVPLQAAGSRRRLFLVLEDTEAPSSLSGRSPQGPFLRRMTCH